MSPASAPPPRHLPLPLTPWSDAALAPFGAFRPRLLDAPPPLLSPPHASFTRCPEEGLTLPLPAGAALLLGPPSDPLRCRALPGATELRALRCPEDGLLSLLPGVWVHAPGLEELPLEQRSTLEVFNLAFTIDPSLPAFDPGPPVWRIRADVWPAPEDL